MRMYMPIVLGLLLAIITGFAAGQVYCPRVISQHNADTSDLGRFRNFQLWKDKQGNELALAVWSYLTSHETGIYHFENVFEGPDPFAEYAQNLEPLKLLNVYNQGYCATMNPMLDGIFRGLGFADGRSISIDRPSHTIMEVWYDNAWHQVDVDLRGVFLKADGAIASFDEIVKEPELGKNKPKDAEFWYSKSDPVKLAGQQYAKANRDNGYRWFTGSHTADWYLRPGESFTRWWTSQGGRWNHRPEYNRLDWLKQNILKAPLGMKSNHPEFSRWTQGNGLFHYAPKLGEPSQDFAAGVWSSEGLESGKDGLVAKAEGANAVFAVFTPFVIVPKVNKLEDFDDDTEASVIIMDAPKEVKVSASLDNGLSWKEAGSLGGEKKSLDLTALVKGLYGYHVKFEPSSGSGELAIRSFSIDTWVQVAPISLPRLMKGTNKLRYDAGDRYDRPTMPMLVLPRVFDPEDLKKYVQELPKNYDPKRSTARIQGDVVVKLAAPKGTKIAWLSAGGNFFTMTGKAAAQSDNRLAYAVAGASASQPTEFKEIWKSKYPDWIGHWRTNYDTDVRLDEPAETVYLKYTGKPGSGGISTIRACLHLSPSVPHDGAVKITHAYRQGGKDMEKVVSLEQPGEYTIDCEQDVENVSIKLEKPSK